MSGPRRDAYEDFAYAYDESLGSRFFDAIRPILDTINGKYPSARKTHLDIACGTGFALEYFRSLGFESTGIDASMPMLGIARRRGRRLIEGDMRAIPLRGKFARITSLYDSLNHLLGVDDLTCTMRHARRLLEDDGLFFFDMNHPAVYRKIWASAVPYVSRSRTHYLSIDTSYSDETRLGVGKVTGWARSGKNKVEISEVRHQRAFTEREIMHALDASRLRPVEVFDFDPFDADGPPVKIFFVVKPV